MKESIYENTMLLISMLFPLVASLMAFNSIIRNKLTMKDNIKILLWTLGIEIILNKFFPVACLLAMFLVPSIFIVKKTKSIFITAVVQIFIAVIIGILDSTLYTIIYVFLGYIFVRQGFLYYFSGFILFLSVIIVSKIFGNLLNRYKTILLENYKSKYMIMLYIMMFLAFCVFYFVLNWDKYLTLEVAVKVQSIVGLVFGLIAVAICIVLLFMVKKEEKYKHEQIEIKNLKEYTDNLEGLYTEMRKFRHDYINIISSIAAFIEDKDIVGLEEYFNMNIQPLNKSINRNNYKLGLLKNINLQEIKGLISAKVLRAQELGIDVIIDIAEVIDKIAMDRIDLVRSLGILLDNAIDAAMESEERRMTVALIKKDQSIIIVISNTYGENILPIGKMFKQGVSSKGENRGLGLSNFKEIVERYKNISLDTYVQDKEFVQEICIHKD